LLRTAREEPPLTPRLAFVRQPAWPQAEDDVKQAFEELVEFLGEEVVAEVELPAVFGDAIAWHQTIMEADVARNLGPTYERASDALSPRLREIIERGRTILAVDYSRALDQIAVLNGILGEVFAEFDAIVTPAGTGEAPLGLDSTGDPVFCTVWTLCGTPAISLPILQGSNGMPMGVQLVGRTGDDARLLRTARWLVGAAADGLA
jgi:Asp-tRNA(Asn)/Glu-tRNA(Gln) amidotransferase A subunit family amidase